MNNNQIIIRLSQACETSEVLSKHIGRVTGLIDAENFAKLMNNLGIESNPRKPKESAVTREINDTLKESPERFHLMSKGILVSSSSCVTLERNRFKLDFENNGYAQPGILDGGHNTYAIAKFLLGYVLDDDGIKKIKDWESLIPVWKAYHEQLSDLFDNTSDENGSLEFKFVIPIEIIFPRNPDDDETLDFWGLSHRDITHARNNNVQLTDATKDNHQGFYDYLKQSLPENIRNKIEWKTNDGGQIKAADIVSLALIPLSRLPKDVIGNEISPVKLYNSKQYCVESFREILEKPGNGNWKGQTYELTNPAIKSAIDLVSELVDLYDFIYEKFPDAYNKAGGKFGRIEGVRIYNDQHTNDKKYSKKPFHTKYYGRETEFQYADGFIVPLVVGLKEIMELDDQDKVKWLFDPKAFLTHNIANILGMYSSIIKFAKFDPQKIGKDKGSYEIVAGAIKMSASNYNKSK
ncbi:AIPR family protein [Methylovulum psychrotolerans]|nr:AIPR family protein [Methylovulum psychrotolerans]MBT9099667.1 AIPR family protein [Methylovulum psychrotolerans]